MNSTYLDVGSLDRYTMVERKGVKEDAGSFGSLVYIYIYIYKQLGQI